VDEVVKDQDSMGMGFMKYMGCSVSFVGSFVEGVWHLRLHYNLFKPIVLSFLFFSYFKDELKANVMEWFPDNENVTHKYLVEMRRMDRDETPFLSVVQLRATILAWWLDDGNVISLDIDDCDRLAHDETSFPPTNPLGIL
jgi:hypothetical protein